ncbi:MAG: hypothetical protein R3C14_41980 [Caldilineaceae bacterium]
MSFPILIQSVNGKYSASLMGAPEIKVLEPTHEKAINALRTIIGQRVLAGEVLFLDLNEVIGVSGLAGKYADDPTLQDICEEAYRLRDAELAEMDE